MTTTLHKQPWEVMSVADDVTTRKLIDGHKLPWHMDRVAAWERGERIAPITIDMALTRQCDAACSFCYAMLQENDRHTITQGVIEDFLVDCQKMGVRAISLLSDGESLLSPAFCYTVRRGKELGMDMASGSNCRMFTPDKQEQVLQYLDYIRINFPAGQKARYCEIMGVGGKFYDQAVANIRNMVRLKHRDGLDIDLGLQMVLMPQDADQILPFVRLAKDMGVDFAIVKHTADDEYGNLGVRYAGYKDIVPLLQEAEALKAPGFDVVVPWSKILQGERRTYQRCYGPPFIMQISGSGLVAPCGDKFNDRYAKFHIGNICEERWYDIWQGERYWEVMDYLRSRDFDASKMCGPLCRQHKVNEALDKHMKGEARLTEAAWSPKRRNFV